MCAEWPSLGAAGGGGGGEGGWQLILTDIVRAGYETCFLHHVTSCYSEGT